MSFSGEPVGALAHSPANDPARVPSARRGAGPENDSTGVRGPTMRIERLFAVSLLLCGCDPAPPTPTPTELSLAKPDHGFQLGTDAMDVPSGKELQACYFFKVPDLNNGQPFYVNKIEVAQYAGSHHMNLFRQGTITGLKGPNADGTGSVVSWDGMGACFKPSSNWADWPLVVNSQIPSATKDGKAANYVLDLSDNPKKDNVAYKFTP